AIMRSRKDSPAWAVMRTTMRSERTMVPPVTPDLSPPASRITGADSPVIADSSTDAIPSMTSPSPGITWFASTTTRSPARSSVDVVGSTKPFFLRRYAGVSRRVRRSDSACAWPRASASAVAKLANRTVAQSHRSRAIRYVTGAWPPCPSSAATAKIAVRTAPISTQNMTGFDHCTSGRSIANERTSAARTSSGASRSARRILRGGRGIPGGTGGSSSRGTATLDWLIVVVLSAAERDRAEVLGERAERRDRQEQESADDHDRPDEEPRERAGVVTQRAETEGRGLLRAEARGHRDGRDDGNESADDDHEPGGDVEGDGGRRRRRIGGEPEGYAEPVEGRAVVRR